MGSSTEKRLAELQKIGARHAQRAGDLAAELELHRALLRQLEWSADGCCPICGEEPDLHDAECRLMAARGSEARNGN